ncbi:MAG: hypothetical protein L6R35_000613 [Caloplaca aegaea]|nr:MAG: hypothetical protein L6R35_000613 [Caloplaca aegaea]
MGSPARPHYFISRPDHTITPLIAVDELPDHIRITGVPPAMSQADTHAMMSLGVKERSIGRYDVQLIKSSSGASSHEVPAQLTNASGTDPSSDASDNVQDVQRSAKQRKHAEEATADSSSIEVVERLDLIDGKEETANGTKAAHEEAEDQESIDVEDWRQKVDTDETQAKIDALIAASAKKNYTVNEKLSDENPRAKREKVGLSPGKKVYCSHWIRTGECDFTQQGCIYKHEMPDNDTLNAIGIRTLPGWYVASHPEKARERGLGRGFVSGGRVWEARRNPLPFRSFTSSRMPSRSQPRVFNQPSALGFHEKNNAPLFDVPAGFSSSYTRASFTPPVERYHGWGRIQELPDQGYPQSSYNPRNHGKELQIVRKPKTPGFNTFPFQLPFPGNDATASTEKPQGKPVPVWAPRQSKLVNGTLHRAEKSTSTSNEGEDTAAPGRGEAAQHLKGDYGSPHTSTVAPACSPIMGRVPQSNAGLSFPQDPSLTSRTLDPGAESVRRATTANSAFPSLKPSPPAQCKPAKPSSHERNASVSSDLFALAPKVPSPMHRRFFVPAGEERYVTATEEPAAVREESAPLKDQQHASKPRDKVKKSLPSENQVGRNERLKNLLDSNNKKRVISPEKVARAKQARKERKQPDDLLVDFEG